MGGAAALRAMAAVQRLTEDSSAGTTPPCTPSHPPREYVLGAGGMSRLRCCQLLVPQASCCQIVCWGPFQKALWSLSRLPEFNGRGVPVTSERIMKVPRH